MFYNGFMFICLRDPETRIYSFSIVLGMTFKFDLNNSHSLVCKELFPYSHTTVVM